MEKWLGKTARLFYRVMIKTGPKGEGAMSAGPGAESLEGKMGSLGGKKGQRDVQRVQASVLREEAVAGGDGGNALPAWSSTLSHSAGDKVA